MADADRNWVHGGNPVLHKVVRGATAERVTTARANDRSTGLLDAFLTAGAELVQDGADGITTSCGFLSIYQRELAAHCRVPVAASALMQIPLVERLLPPQKRFGVLTFSAALLGPDHLVAAGAAPDTPVVGAERGLSSGVSSHVTRRRSTSLQRARTFLRPGTSSLLSTRRLAPSCSSAQTWSRSPGRYDSGFRCRSTTSTASSLGSMPAFGRATSDCSTIPCR